MHGFWAGTNAMRYDNFYCSALHSLFLRYSICGAVQSEPGPQLDSTEAVPSPQLN
jgi:hypothetical protein